MRYIEEPYGAPRIRIYLLCIQLIIFLIFVKPNLINKPFLLGLKPQQYRGYPGEGDGDVALDNLIVAFRGELVPGNFFFAAGAGVGAVGHWGGADFYKAGPIPNFWHA